MNIFSISILIFMVKGLHHLTTGQTCTDRNNIGHVVRGTYIKSTHWTSTTTSGTLSCAAQCLFRSSCKSFNFNTDSGRCALFNFNSSSTEYKPLADPSYIFSDIGHWNKNLVVACADHSCPENTVCEVVNGVIKCTIEGCPLSPIANGAIVDEGSILRPFGDILNYTCEFGFAEEGQAECLDTGNWTNLRCRPVPGTCVEVQRCDGEDTDGEYWIYLNQFKNERVPVYCYGMNTSQPEEYITLVHPNSGVYPPTYRYNCGVEKTHLNEARLNRIGSTEYAKIRIYITTLQVNITSKTFASGTAVNLGAYAVSADCYINYDISIPDCVAKGNFTVDLRDTGFQLDTQQAWEADGWMPFMNVTWLGPASVYLNCGGYCGKCAPVGGLFLAPSSGGVPGNTSAKTSSCDVGG